MDPILGKVVAGAPADAPGSEDPPNNPPLKGTHAQVDHATALPTEVADADQSN